MKSSKYVGPLLNCETIASSIEVPLSNLLAIAEKCDQFYHPPRLEPKGDGRFRTINPPFASLKEIQRKLNKLCFGAVEFAPYLKGGVRNRSYVESTRIHSKSFSVLTVDVADFFPSISADVVENIWREFFGFEDDVVQLLTALTTYGGRLPQGAPTSTPLANLVFFDTEPTLVAGFYRRRLRYTRLVDDINVSATVPFQPTMVKWILLQISQMLASRDCQMNESKQKIQDRSNPCRVHGLLINSGHPTKGRKKIANIRASIYQLEKSLERPDASQSEILDAFRFVQGVISELNQYQPQKARDLRLRLKEIKRKAQSKWTSFC